MTMSSKTYLIMAGGTGGHIFPALAVAQELRQRGHKVIWLGSEGAMETRIVPQDIIPLELLAIKGVRGNGLKRKLGLPITLFKAIRHAKNIIKKHRIDAVIGFGGFVTFPGGVAAKMLGIPLIIHEQNAIAGLSNRVLAKFSNRVLYAFPDALPAAEGLVGNPVRSDIVEMPKPEDRFASHSGALKLLVVGGSLGAKIFNDMLPHALSLIPEEKRPMVTHQSGRGKLAELKSNYQAVGVEANCIEFVDDMVSAYTDADFIICRAGALTVSELAAAGLGGVLVPYPWAVDDHQTLNAQYLVNGHAAICFAQEKLSPQVLADFIVDINREKCLQWAKNARALALPDSAKEVADAAEKVFVTH